MDNTDLIRSARGNIRSLLDHCNVQYEVTPFDADLYQDCIDDAIQHGYPVEGSHSVVTNLRGGVMYACTSGVHLSHRPTRIWIALYTSCIIYVDDVADRFISEMPKVYLFNDRFITKEPQGNPVLDTFADILRRASDLFRPIASHLLTTSTMNFVTACLLEYETRTMKILSTAQQYPTYLRVLSGIAEAYSVIIFPREIPLNDYIQAIPEMVPFLSNVNDILSFYKEELDRETTNQVSTLAERAKTSKLEVLDEMTETTINLYKKILIILEHSPKACEAFKLHMGGYVRFHTSTPRYRLGELGL